MTGTIHKFNGDWKEVFQWDSARTRRYGNDPSNQVTETWMIGKKEGAENFAFRYYQLEDGARSREEQHQHDHGVFVLQGTGEVLLGEEVHPISRGDIIYIPPDVLHQLRNTGQDPLGFICVIPARREKAGGTVWAEEGIDFDKE